MIYQEIPPRCGKTGKEEGYIMWIGSLRYKRIKICIMLIVAVFFAAGVFAEYELMKTDMHLSDSLGDFIWAFSGGKGFSECSARGEYALTALRGLKYPALLCILLFLCGFTVYAPAVSAVAAAYSAATFGALCMRTAELTLGYLFLAVVCSASLVAVCELCIYSAYLGRALSHKAPPNVKLLFVMPEVRELFFLLCSCACRLIVYITLWMLISPHLTGVA